MTKLTANGISPLIESHVEGEVILESEVAAVVKGKPGVFIVQALSPRGNIRSEQEYTDLGEARKAFNHLTGGSE